MHDYTLKADTRNPARNVAALKGEMMSITQRWEAGFEHGYFCAGSRISLGEYQEYSNGFHCGWEAYTRVRDGNPNRLNQWQEEKSNYVMGRPYKVPFQRFPKARLIITIADIQHYQGNRHMRKNTNFSFKVETALSALNVLILEDGLDYSDALWETLNMFAVSERELVEAYDNQFEQPMQPPRTA
jgi:hypothetical protein